MNHRLLALLGLAALLAGCSSPPAPPPTTATPGRRPTSRARPRSAEAEPPRGGSSDGVSCEQAVDENSDELSIGKKQDEDLASSDLGDVLNKGSYLNDCEVPADARVAVCAAVKEGRAVGVTVALSPSSPDVERCVAGKIRALGFPMHPKLHVARTTFE